MDYLVLLILNAIEIYTYIILVYVVVGYFPEARHTKFYHVLSSICEPILNLFRFATFQGISFAPILAFLFLEFISYLIRAIYFY